MNYQQTLDYLYAQLPMFHRIGPAAYKANLDNTLALASYLGNPEKQFRSVHVAGTNGKGSVSHIMASALQEAGYKTGLCTSPHLKDFRERFRINGQMMPKDFVVSFVNEHMEFFESIKPSFFEMTIAMTYLWFAEQQVDIAVVETGLGGRLDSTNIINPEVSVITNVGLDHVNLLGNSVEEIAREKAGIIKEGVPIVAGKCRREALEVIRERAVEKHSLLIEAPSNISIRQYSFCQTSEGRVLKGKIFQQETPMLAFSCPLSGTYQLENIATAVQALKTLHGQGEYLVNNDAIAKGLENVVQNTGMAGRWQTLSIEPLVICDTGHNADGITSILENIQLTPHKHLHFVLGMMNDKDIEGILKLLPADNTSYYFCKPNVPRGLEVQILADKARLFGLEGRSFLGVREALAEARANAGKEDLVFVGGSTFVVAEVV